MQESTDKIWQGEVLFRQGTSVKKFSTPEEACDWTDAQVRAAASTVNPARSSTVRLNNARPTTPPPAGIPFDEREW